MILLRPKAHAAPHAVSAALYACARFCVWGLLVPSAKKNAWARRAVSERRPAARGHGLALMPDQDWQCAFDDSIKVPDGRTLSEAGNYVAAFNVTPVGYC